MSLYTMGNVMPEATALRARLAAWHDAMVIHERKIRAGRTEEPCDEECPHAQARMLWVEALEVFGDQALALTFLRSRAATASEPREELVAPADVLAEAADRGPRPKGSGHKATPKRGGIMALNLN